MMSPKLGFVRKKEHNLGAVRLFLTSAKCVLAKKAYMNET